MAKKKKGGLVIVIVAVVVLAIGGAGAMAAMGKLPFLAKKGTTPPSTYGEGKEPPKGDLATKKPEEKVAGKEEEKPKKAPPVAVAPAPDVEKGAKKLASVWNNMEVAQLARVAKEYPEDGLPLVVSRMDPEKASELLAALDPKFAAKLSGELYKLGARPDKVE
ncbi:MAG: hypothetical protein JSS65_11100 [Armatimonadetes bacterium]|nr:hypothetical protein [Armatimonadota bacterium]